MGYVQRHGIKLAPDKPHSNKKINIIPGAKNPTKRVIQKRLTNSFLITTVDILILF